MPIVTREDEDETEREAHGGFAASEAEAQHEPPRALVVGHDTDFRAMLSDLLSAS